MHAIETRASSFNSVAPSSWGALPGIDSSRHPGCLIRQTYYRRLHNAVQTDMYPSHRALRSDSRVQNSGSTRSSAGRPARSGQEERSLIMSLCRLPAPCLEGGRHVAPCTVSQDPNASGVTSTSPPVVHYSSVRWNLDSGES